MIKHVTLGPQVIFPLSFSLSLSFFLSLSLSLSLSLFLSLIFHQQCNNPLTKEPKLVSAMRIVPEWTSYDQEVRLLQERVAQGQSASPQQPKDRDKGEETEHRDEKQSESKHKHGEL